MIPLLHSFHTHCFPIAWFNIALCFHSLEALTLKRNKAMSCCDLEPLLAMKNWPSSKYMVSSRDGIALLYSVLSWFLLTRLMSILVKIQKHRFILKHELEGSLNGHQIVHFKHLGLLVSTLLLWYQWQVIEPIRTCMSTLSGLLCHRQCTKQACKTVLSFRFSAVLKLHIWYNWSFSESKYCICDSVEPNRPSLISSSQNMKIKASIVISDDALNRNTLQSTLSWLDYKRTFTAFLSAASVGR